MINNQDMPENPTPDQSQAGDMGKGSFQESQDRGKREPASKQGPRRVPVRRQRTTKK